MPVSKLLIFLLVLLAIYLLRRALVRPPAARPDSGEPAKPAVPAVERMVECAHCGLHVPESEAVAADGLDFCCEAHRQAHRQTPRAGG
jgi:uncharacterized protein